MIRKKSIILFLMLCSILLSSLYSMPSYNDVLVVVNNNSPESIEIADYFKQQRQIPDINICYVSTPNLTTYEIMQEADKVTLADNIADYLTANA